MRKVLAATACVALLAGCTPPLEYGDIEGKDYYAAYDSMVPIVTCAGNPIICTTNFIFTHEDERWVLHLRQGPKTGDRNVT
ncbi:hypothetical protein [Mycobacteroides immunogenum]|uniref:Uncharacterized protein n=1 Tax=Mycobacteroides immunogenum TaxID=83262 RepID=A0A7V8LQU3_9MYCO|nr:hypothetical protein [Mycobacteroides immunogenum]KPG13716.1 hypothetical protein AN909_05490 [Mycobacteroides immunogenum]KPG14295.1 hypothetical protein AN908_06915 [Mycobacteroides immunogenum]KPG14364.1 hypothetical protein AN908_07380 [Mycobacteroides immunogenum]KPG17430.1 hypothetical protein AN910_04715 [Mycobacteroides immunogenum]KPG23986.1 hypothetical protein AN911_00445 [Mycobacteroides immunogenum]